MNIKTIVSTVVIAATLTGTSVVIAEAATSKTAASCAEKNLKAKAKVWGDILAGRNYAPGTVPSFAERERQVAADMKNAAVNMKSGSYRVCWALDGR